jgi:ribonucleoside-diphosphate reductase alpha chain
MIPLLARKDELVLKDYCFSYLKDGEGVIQDRDVLVGLHSLGYRWDWDEETQRVSNVAPGPADEASIIRVEDGVEETLDLSVPGTHSYVVNGLISHNTANLPNGYTFEQYKDLFMYAYKQGLKGFTSFNPEGSMKGVLEAPSAKDKPVVGDTFIARTEAPKRPETLPCDIFHIHADKKEFLVLAGTLNGSLYEIFVDEGSHDLKDAKTGWITKRKKGEYTLKCDNGASIENIGKDFNGTYGILTRFISMSLRHGAPLPFIMRQLQKSKEFLGFEKAVSRVLKYYVKEGERLEIKEKCPSCGGELVFQDGCKTCKDCGYSGCA